MEKELNIILNREDENVICITSNFQEDLELLEVEEITPIILDLINGLMKKIKREVVAEKIGEREFQDIDNDEAGQILEKADNEISNHLGNLFFEIINFVKNVDAEEPKNFDYSMAVYGIDETTNTKEIYETFHYGDIKEHEKLLSCFAFYKDIADKLSKTNSKEQTKLLFKKAFNVMLASIYTYIDK